MINSIAPASLRLSPHLSSWLQTWRREGAWWWASYLNASPHSAATFTLGAGLLFLLCRKRLSGQITLRLLPKLPARICGLCRVRACPRCLRCSSPVKLSISLGRLLTAPPSPLHTQPLSFRSSQPGNPKPLSLAPGNRLSPDTSSLSPTRGLSLPGAGDATSPSPLPGGPACSSLNFPRLRWEV